ncbi:MAG: hypothetical protein KF795_33275 [Labilithrix sp.]|nr:hypothetical protein [Labilithrix sp.]
MSSDDEFEQFLRSADALGAPSADDALRVKAGLSSSVPWKHDLPASISTALRASRAAASGPRFGLRSRFVKLAGIAVSIAGLSATTYTMVAPPGRTAGLSTRAPNDAVASSAAGAAPSQGVEDVSPSAPATDPAPILTIDGPAKLPSVPSAPPPVKPARRAGTLDAEVALLAETNAALQSKDPSRALALVEQHAREFPRGVLGPEFDAQRALALSALGRDGEACVVASRFLAAYPNSPLAPQVRSSCIEFDR